MMLISQEGDFNVRRKNDEYHVRMEPCGTWVMDKDDLLCLAKALDEARKFIESEQQE